MMSEKKIHIYEENINLFWGLLGLITIAGGAYLLADAFFGGSWQWLGFQQLSSLFLFAIGFYAIVQLTEPLYRFDLFADDGILRIEIWQGSETLHGIREILTNDINEVKIMRHSPRGENEALFDFSTNYHLLYRTSKEEVYQDLIALPGQSFTLKLKDIQKVVSFLGRQNTHFSISDDGIMNHLMSS